MARLKSELRELTLHVKRRDNSNYKEGKAIAPMLLELQAAKERLAKYASKSKYDDAKIASLGAVCAELSAKLHALHAPAHLALGPPHGALGPGGALGGLGPMHAGMGMGMGIGLVGVGMGMGAGVGPVGFAQRHQQLQATSGSSPLSRAQQQLLLGLAHSPARARPDALQRPLGDGEWGGEGCVGGALTVERELFPAHPHPHPQTHLHPQTYLHPQTHAHPPSPAVEGGGKASPPEQNVKQHSPEQGQPQSPSRAVGGEAPEGGSPAARRAVPSQSPAAGGGSPGGAGAGAVDVGSPKLRHDAAAAVAAKPRACDTQVIAHVVLPHGP
jgi:hypothetical protein